MDGWIDEEGRKESYYVNSEMERRITVEGIIKRKIG